MRASGQLIDSFGRVHRDLRVSVTDRCNFRCTYCMPAEGMTWMPRSEILSFEEIEQVARVEGLADPHHVVDHPDAEVPLAVEGDLVQPVRVREAVGLSEVGAQEPRQPLAQVGTF
jgi:hypothetical protein